ncbi:MAG: PEGA domain-containing protein [Candidatus Sulfotelmatobacter sp.]
MFAFSALNSTIRTLAFAVLLLSGVLAASVVKKPCFNSDQAKAAIAGWKNDNTALVVLDKAATRGLISGNTCAGQLDNSFPLADSKDDFVVGSYLYELRDRKYTKMGSPILSNDLKISLGLDDIQALPFERFSLEMGAAIWQDPGELTVESSPTGASIMIDDQPRGMTRKDFVLSKGKHSIFIKSDNVSCAETIDIKDEPLTYECPKKVRVSKPAPEPPKN